MGIELQRVIPLGRNFEEYTAMFGLTDPDFKLRILDCGGGPSSFNYEANQKGGNVTSIDPIYQFSANEIQQRIHETFEGIMAQTEENKEKFVWKSIRDVDDLREKRQNAMKLFVDDFESGKSQGRYLYQELPGTKFEDNMFDMALSSHFLFLYSDILSYDFHKDAIAEMLRVAREVRIFPLVNLNAVKSEYVSKIVEEFSKIGCKVDMVKTDYEFQRDANEYMKITKV